MGFVVAFSFVYHLKSHFSSWEILDDDVNKADVQPTASIVKKLKERHY